jgi:hypothetical protein
MIAEGNRIRKESEDRSVVKQLSIYDNKPEKAVSRGRTQNPFHTDNFG